MKGIWLQASRLAERTPPERNRYVDLLRALAILVVVFGHWLAAAPYMAEEGLEITSMLGVVRWSHWLTWALQVMPVFFIVGGYSNGASWEAARRDGRTYQDWLNARLTRLVTPLLPLLLVWVLIGIAAGIAGIDPRLVSTGSRLALVPTWFLAVYMMVILMVPVAAWAWRRYGLASFWLPLSGAILVDSLAFAHGFTILRWTNYAFIWLAVHQLGFLWRDSRADQATVSIGWALGGLSVLVFLVEMADYPIAMLTVPGAEFSNSRPPTVALAALAAMQFGVVTLLQPIVRPRLERNSVWTGVVMVNGFIMTLFLWHSTVQVMLIGLAAWAGGIGLHWTPGSGQWWTARPLWIAAMLLVLLPVVAAFIRFERGSRRTAETSRPAAMQVTGTLLICLGVALLAWAGIGSDSFPWVRILPLAMTFGGAALVLTRPAGE